MWGVASTAEFEDWVKNLDSGAQTEIVAKVELLKALGPHLGRPHVDTLKGSKYPNLKELRVTWKKSVLRVAFAFDPTRSGILLVGGNKVGRNERQFYRELIQWAEKLYERHLIEIKRRREH